MANRILIFSLNYYPFVGGAEIAIQEITDRIPPQECEFHLICYRFNSALPREEKIGNVYVHRIGIGKKGMTIGESFKPIVYLGKILYVPLAAAEAWKLSRALRFNTFWAMMSYMLFPIVLLRMLGNKTPYLLTLQEGDPFERVFERWRIRIFVPLLRYGFRHASAVQAISIFLLTWAGKIGFTGRGEVIPNGVDIAAFTRNFSADEITEEKKRLGKKEGDIFLVTTSRLVHKNAVDDVIRTLRFLPSQISFLIYGEGSDEEMLRALAKKCGVEERVRFMGHIAHADLPRTLRACDIFIRPSRSEGMGNSFIEAMAVGLPVIATQEGGIADFLYDEKRNPEKKPTGWAVDANSPEQIAKAVENVRTHPEQVQHVTATAKNIVMQKYDWNSVASRMQNLFLSLASEKSS